MAYLTKEQYNYDTAGGSCQAFYVKISKKIFKTDKDFESKAKNFSLKKTK